MRETAGGRDCPPLATDSKDGKANKDKPPRELQGFISSFRSAIWLATDTHKDPIRAYDEEWFAESALLTMGDFKCARLVKRHPRP